MSKFQRNSLKPPFNQFNRDRSRGILYLRIKQKYFRWWPNNKTLILALYFNHNKHLEMGLGPVIVKLFITFITNNLHHSYIIHSYLIHNTTMSLMYYKYAMVISILYAFRDNLIKIMFLLHIEMWYDKLEWKRSNNIFPFTAWFILKTLHVLSQCLTEPFNCSKVSDGNDIQIPNSKFTFFSASYQLTTTCNIIFYQDISSQLFTKYITNGNIFSTLVSHLWQYHLLLIIIDEQLFLLKSSREILLWFVLI